MKTKKIKTEPLTSTESKIQKRTAWLIFCSISLISENINKITITADDQSAYSEEVSASFGDFLNLTSQTSEISNLANEEVTKQKNISSEIVELSNKLNQASEELHATIDQFKI